MEYSYPVGVGVGVGVVVFFRMDFKLPFAIFSGNIVSTSNYCITKFFLHVSHNKIEVDFISFSYCFFIFVKSLVCKGSTKSTTLFLAFYAFEYLDIDAFCADIARNHTVHKHSTRATVACNINSFRFSTLACSVFGACLSIKWNVEISSRSKQTTAPTTTSHSKTKKKKIAEL